MTAESPSLQGCSALNRVLGYTPLTKKLACFVLYLKIFNTFLKSNIILYYKLIKEIKNTSSIRISISQAVHELFFKTKF